MKDSSQAIDELEAKRLIIGTWQWYESISQNMGGYGRGSPESLGYTEQRKFLPNGTVEFYKDGELVGTYPYEVGSFSPRFEPPIYRLTIGDQGVVRTADGRLFDGTQAFKVSGDKLVIGYGGYFGYCGVDHFYTRVKEPIREDGSPD
jgi:hypothetical protein